MFSNVPIIPKNSDGVLRIISIGRLSKPKDSEDETHMSLEAIRNENARLLTSVYKGPTVIKYLAEQISGMIPDRETMNQLWELVESGEWDLIVAEDLSRVFRNPRWQWAFVQDCVDARIRVIVFGDSIDTASETWETTTAVATLRHGLMIPDTRRRIKRTATESFKNGGMVLKVKAFYAKLTRDEASSGIYGPKGLRMRKLMEYAWVVDEIRRRLRAKQSPRSVVAWLRVENIPCGPYAKRWTLRLLRDLLQDPILHGTRTFRNVVHQQIYRTGKYRRDKNPAPEMEYVDELAFMTRAEQEEMLANVGWAIDWGGVKPPERPSKRKGVSRYESYWPAQSTDCAICEALMYANGPFLKCSNTFARHHQTCWNHVLAPMAPLRAAVVNWLVGQCDQSTDFRDVLLIAAKEQLKQRQRHLSIERDAIDAKVKDLECQERNLLKSIRISTEIGEDDLKSLVTDLAGVTAQLRDARRQADITDDSPPLMANYDDDEIIANLGAVLGHLLETSFEMAEIMRGFIPRCIIVPVQSLDTGQVFARAKLLVRANMANREELQEVVVDLFEPALHIRHMPEAVRLRSQEPRPTLKQIGAALGVSYMTIKRSLGYARAHAGTRRDRAFS